MTKAQLRGALSIDVGQASLLPQKTINDIDAVISRCENLLQVDEDFDLVQFAHRSIRQFLVEEDLRPPLDTYRINMDDAGHRAGELCVTYLNLNDFKTTLATRDRLDQNLDPRLLAQVALDSGGKPSVHTRAMKALNRLSIRQKQDTQIAYPVESLATYGRADSDALESLRDRHPFITYAGRWWIYHTTHFSETDSRMWHQWQQMLVQGHSLAQVPWNCQPLQPLDVKLLEWCAAFDHEPLMRVIARHEPMSDAERVDLFHYTASSGHAKLLELLDLTLSDNARREAVTLRKKRGHKFQSVARTDMFLHEETQDVFGEQPGQHPRFCSTYTALQLASFGGHLATVKKLLSMGADPNAPASIGRARIERLYYDYHGFTALQGAVLNDHVAVAIELLRAGADSNFPSKTWGPIEEKQYVRERTPLQSAVARGSLEMAGVFIDAGANVNHYRDEEEEPLMLAINQPGGLALVELLLAAGAETHMETDEPRPPWSNTSPLRLAAKLGSLEIVDRILQRAKYFNDDLIAKALKEAEQSGHEMVATRIRTAVRLSKRRAA